MTAHHFVCDRCGHHWTDAEISRCRICGYNVANLWRSDTDPADAETNAKAQSLRLTREYAERVAREW